MATSRVQTFAGYSVAEWREQAGNRLDQAGVTVITEWDEEG